MESNFYYQSPYIGHANQTLLWLPQDSEERYEHHLKTKYHELESQGWIGRTIEYKFNSEGFRADEFIDNQPSIITLGCSLTVGIGLPLEETWAYQVAQALNLHMYNLGIGGRSSDVAFRLALHYVPKLKPQVVVFVPPDPGRFEVIVPRDNHTICENYGPWTPNVSHTESVDFYKKWILSDDNSYLNRAKNIMAIKHLCHTHNIKCVTASRHHLISNPGNNYARDLSHPGAKINQEFASIVLDKINSN